MRSPLQFLLFLIAASVTAVAARDACLASLPAITALDMGFANHFKLGAWTPVVVTLQGGSESFAGRVEVDAPDSDGVPVTFATPEDRPISVKPGKQQRATVLVKVGRGDAQLRVRAVGRSGDVAARSFLTRSVSAGRGGNFPKSLSGTSRLIVVLGPPIGLADALRDDLLRDDVATFVANVETAAALPEIWPAFDGVDTIVLSAGTDKSPAGMLSRSQRASLLQWVSLGGRVVLATGGDAERLLAADGPLAEFLPGRLDGSRELPEARAIEMFCDSDYPIKVRGGRLGVRVPILEDLRGRILAFEGAATNPLPLITRENRGLGEIIYIGFDVAQPPLADWAGRADLLFRLLGNLSPDDVAFVEKASTGLTSLGYNDLVGQLRASLDVFGGVQTAPFALVAALAIAYIAIIGPVDYYVVRRWLARPALTWLTLPMWIALFSLLAWWLANGFKGNAAHANSVELVDIDVATGKVRGTMWSHIFNPQLDSLDLSLEVRLPGGRRPADAHSRFAWLGLPGNALGGMQGSGDDALRTIGYAVSPTGDAIHGMTLAKWSTKSLSAQWIAQTDRSVRAQLVAADDDLLTGRIENAFGETLANARLFHGRWAWSLGDLPPGATVDLAAGGDPRAAQTLLNGRPLTGYGGGEDYNPAGTQIGRILDRMMWYELAGGTSAAKLLNRNQAFCDMSALVGSGRAILVGDCAAEGSRVTTSGGPIAQAGDLQRVICRFVIPIPST